MKSTQISKLFLVILSLFHLGCVEQKSEETNAVKITIFNDVEETIDALSSARLGKLTKWKSDGGSGFISLTFPEDFGSPNERGLYNNLNYVVTSDSIDYIERIYLYLYINQIEEKESALLIFSDLSEMTFKNLSLGVPENLLKSIKQEEKFGFEDEFSEVSLRRESKSLDYWRLAIYTK